MDGPTPPGALRPAAALPPTTSPVPGWTDGAHLVSPLYLPHLGAVRDARAWVQEQLEAVGLHRCAQDAGLMVCELAANAVLHARTPFTVHLRPTLEGGIRVEVHDHSPLPPVFTAPSPTAMSGRGLNLVASLATRWGSHPVLPAEHAVAPGPPGGRPRPAAGAGQNLGKIVWFELEGSVAPPAEDASIDELIARWDDEAPPEAGALPPAPVHAGAASGSIVSSLPAADHLRWVAIHDLPTVELLVAEEAMDDLLRELQLLLLSPGPGEVVDDSGAGPISRPQRALEGELLAAAHLDSAARGFESARRQIREQVTRAAARREALVTLHLLLDSSAARAAERYRDALSAAEQEGSAARLSSVRDDLAWHADVRRHSLNEIIRQLGRESG